MKNKRRKKLHSYIMFLLAVCILLGFLLDNLKDFFIGFFAGWNEMSNIEDARIMYGNLGQMIGWIIIGTSLITIGVCCYKSLRRKVTEPIERLANNMNEVREGNLTIRTLVDGDFEIIDMQDAFNSMVEELENAKKIGVDINNLLVSQPDCGEQALEIAEALARSGVEQITLVDNDTVNVTYINENNEETTTTLTKIDGALPTALTTFSILFQTKNEEYTYKMLNDNIGYLRITEESINVFSDDFVTL